MSLTPVILRWNFLTRFKRWQPWFQGAGGLIYTTHKFPPDQLVPKGTPGGTSVWNFSPQGGIGIHYFMRPRRSIDLGVNAVHISSASLGDQEPRRERKHADTSWIYILEIVLPPVASGKIAGRSMNGPVVECVPNFSEGTDVKTVEAIVSSMHVEGVRLLDWSMDADHNRSVVTIAGEPAAIVEAAVRGVGKAAELIDLTQAAGCASSHRRGGRNSICSDFGHQAGELRIACAGRQGWKSGGDSMCPYSFTRRRLPGQTGQISKKCAKDSLKG